MPPKSGQPWFQEETPSRFLPLGSGERSGKALKRPKSQPAARGEPLKIFREQRAELFPASSLRQSTQPRRLRKCRDGGRPPAPQPPDEAPAEFELQPAWPGAPGHEGG